MRPKRVFYKLLKGTTPDVKNLVNSNIFMISIGFRKCKNYNICNSQKSL